MEHQTGRKRDVMLRDGRTVSAVEVMQTMPLDGLVAESGIPSRASRMFEREEATGREIDRAEYV